MLKPGVRSPTRILLASCLGCRGSCVGRLVVFCVVLWCAYVLSNFQRLCPFAMLTTMIAADDDDDDI